MSFNSSQAIQEIKDRADIVELVSDHVVLKRTGANYSGLCPFHNDSKPSMQVSPSKGIFKCFSCGVGGDVFKFWSEYHKKDFKETLKDLAQKYGVQLSFTEAEAEASKTFNLKIRMHELAAKYYVQKLLGSNEAAHCRKYLEERNISTASIEKFQIGYSPAEANDWAKLTKHLKAELNVTEAQIVDAGLASARKDGQGFYDRFRGRLMIPIHDERGRAIAFGARALKDPQTGEEASPKYLNSAETQIYHKGNNLYGLHLAKEHIRKLDKVIVVEGYFDVITAHQSGIENVVANQGTALTAQQAKLLAKFSDSKKIYLCFDTDKAGEEATERAFETIAQAASGVEAEVRIIRVPNGKDPDELLRFGGVEAFIKKIEEAPIIFDYQIDKIIQATDLKSPREKGKSVNALAKVLRNVKNQIEKTEYFHIISEKLGVDESALKDQMNQEIRNMRPENVNPYQNMAPAIQEEAKKSQSKFISQRTHKRVNGQIIYIEDGISTTEKEILVMAVNDKDILEEFLASGKTLFSESFRKILDYLTDISFENPDIDDPNIKYQMLSDKMVIYPEYATQLADIGIALDIEQHKAEKDKRFKDAVRKLDRFSLKKEMEELIVKIKEVEKNNSDDDLWLQLQKEKQELVSKLQK